MCLYLFVENTIEISVAMENRDQIEVATFQTFAPGVISDVLEVTREIQLQNGKWLSKQDFSALVIGRATIEKSLEVLEVFYQTQFASTQYDVISLLFESNSLPDNAVTAHLGVQCAIECEGDVDQVQMGFEYRYRATSETIEHEENAQILTLVTGYEKVIESILNKEQLILPSSFQALYIAHPIDVMFYVGT